MSINVDYGRRRTFSASPYISPKEEEFIRLCKKHNLPIQQSGSGEQHVYTFAFDWQPLDSVEKNVRSHCIENGIKFEYYRDLDGNHHYNFSKMIDTVAPDACETHLKLVSYDAIKAKYSHEPDPVPIPAKKWWEKILKKLGLTRIKKIIPKTEEEKFLDSLGLKQEDLLKLGLPELAFPPAK